LRNTFLDNLNFKNIKITKKFSLDSQFNIVVRPIEFIKDIITRIYRVISHESLLMISYLKYQEAGKDKSFENFD
jgi:hypothetical protein